jgi:UDP-N-acetylmuramoylalanine--D-glutamate ligase
MKVCVLGLGKSGVAAANLALKLGYETFASDSGKKRSIKKLNKKVSTEFGGHSAKVFEYPLIIKSPGIHSDIPILKEAAKRKIETISELSFALRHSKRKKIIAVTGTNGKTTVTDLISKIIKAAYKDSVVCGNIGFPLSDKALQTTQNTFIIMELSSYQLEDTPDFKPDISVSLNITPDHLEHHGTMAKYIKAKENIHANQTRKGFAVVNYDDKICVKSALKTKAEKIFFSKYPLKKGVYCAGGEIVINLPSCIGAPTDRHSVGKGSKKVVINPKINIVGMHNVENVLAAAAATYCAGVDPSVIEKVISSYKGVEHRIEYVKTVGGAKYYNDSKSTNVDSARVALESFDGRILLIMGGLDKGSPYSPLKKLVEKRVKAVFLIGSASSKIKKELSGSSVFYDCGNIENAVKKVFSVAEKGDTVLLSPACASFDQFDNFEERGKIFKKLVLDLRNV